MMMMVVVVVMGVMMMMMMMMMIMVVVMMVVVMMMMTLMILCLWHRSGVYCGGKSKKLWVAALYVGGENLRIGSFKSQVNADHNRPQSAEECKVREYLSDFVCKSLWMASEGLART
jgi:fatty-acid desaturase